MSLTINNNPFECGRKLKTGFDYFAKGFCKNELVDSFYRLVADRRQSQLLLESADFCDIDTFYNPGEPLSDDDENNRMTTSEAMILEAVRVKSYARTAQTMAALQRVLNKHLASTGKNIPFPGSFTPDTIGEPIQAGDAIIGDPKKSGLFASVTVQFPINDGQTLSIIFHSPDNNKMKITAADEIIAFRWLLNKRDITSAVSPDAAEEGNLPGLPAAAKDVSLEDVGIRCAQLIVKNSDRFQAKSKEIQENKKALEDLRGTVQNLQDHNGEIQQALAAKIYEGEQADSQINATQKQLQAQIGYNDELRGKLDALKASKKGNEGKDHGEDTTGGVNKADQDAAEFETKKTAFSGELAGRGFASAGASFTLDAAGQNLLANIVYEESQYKVGVRYYSNASTGSPEDKIFSSKTIVGIDAQITAALKWIDKKLADMKIADVKIDYSSPEGYAQIKGNKELELKYQDDLDALFTTRIVSLRNALGALGWTANSHNGGLVKGNTEVNFDFTYAGDGKNVTGITAVFDPISAGGDKPNDIEDTLTQSPEGMAQAIDAVAPVAIAPNLINGDNKGGDDPEKAEEKAALNTLSDIVGGKYGMDRKAIDAAIDDVATVLERLGLMEQYDAELNAAADELTRVLKEAAKGAA